MFVSIKFALSKPRMASLVLKLTGDNANQIRGMVSPDGMQVFSVFDFMTKVCTYPDDGNTARKTFGRLTRNESENKNEISASCHYVKFPGPGQRDTPCMNVQGLLMLLKCLGDKVSRAFKEETFAILQRYLDGDTTMCEEIMQNKNLGKQKAYENFTEKVMKRAKTYADSASNEMPATAYVYGTKSDAFPGLIKIGRSINPTTRLSSLNTGCAPAPHVLVAVAPTFNNVRDEAVAHAFFSSQRKEGEFFEVSQEDVRAFFTNHITAQYQTELAQHIARVHESCP